MSRLVDTTADPQVRDVPAHTAEPGEVADRLGTGAASWLRILLAGLAVIAVNEAHKWRQRRRDARPTPLRHPTRSRSETP